MTESSASLLRDGKAVLGLELGSTRIKAVLIDNDHKPLAIGTYDWENRLENGLWTYAMQDVWAGIQEAYANLKSNVQKQYGVRLERIACLGVSAMMHGYLPFDAHGTLLVPFRTWRNTVTGPASKALTELFHFHVPQRWSVAHLYQAMLNNETHVKDIAFLTTLAGYVHWMLTGEKVLGIGDASGMFPIDSKTQDYDCQMLSLFDQKSGRYPWKLRNLLPKVLPAGQQAGILTAKGAALLDPKGDLQPGVPLCPPEGDAGTGMTATNSVAQGTGNVSAGTSVFAMVVLERALSRAYSEIDMVTTPDGKPVAMVHCNNCTSDINAWVNVFQEFAQAAGGRVEREGAFSALCHAAMGGQKECGGLINYNYLSGEPITGFADGRPMLVRMPDTPLTFCNLARSLVFGAIATLRLGMNILMDEKVTIHTLLAHGGFFKTEGTAQKLLASALNTPVAVMETAGEGGPWGMALLAAFCVHKRDNESLQEYLNRQVFCYGQVITEQSDPEDMEGFHHYLQRFCMGLTAERAAVEALN